MKYAKTVGATPVKGDTQFHTPEHEHGVLLNPGWPHDAKIKMTSRSPKKHNKFEREPIPE
jgi:hypothetical protein